MTELFIKNMKLHEAYEKYITSIYIMSTKSLHLFQKNSVFFFEKGGTVTLFYFLIFLYALLISLQEKY
jgi:hypothetical protein